MMLLSTGSLSFVRENMKHAAFGVAFVPKQRAQCRADRRRLAGHVQGPRARSRRQAGWKFAKWLSSTETLGGWSRFTGYFSPRKSPYDTAEMKDFMAKNPEAKVALDQLPYAKPWFATYQTVAVRKALEDEIQAVLERQEEGAPGGQGRAEERRCADEAVCRPDSAEAAVVLRCAPPLRGGGW